MKYLVSILFVLIIVGGSAAIVIHQQQTDSNISETFSQTTAVPQTDTTASSGGEKLLAELKDEDFQLYTQGSTVILVHNSQECAFTNWSSYIGEETPEMYYEDFNNDDEKELLLKIVSGIDSVTGRYIYDLYFLFPSLEEDGSYSYIVTLASRNTWKQKVDSLITAKMNQLDDKKHLQFAMDNYDTSISYDDAGIASCYAVSYARADSDADGTYYTLNQWEKGAGFYTVNNGMIYVDIMVVATYKETEEALPIGFMRFGIGMESKSFYLREHSAYFYADENHLISDPRVTAEEAWFVTFENRSSYSASDTVIDEIDETFDLEKGSNIITEYFSSRSTKIKMVSSVEFKDSQIILTAKDGCSFDENIVQSGNYSVVISGDEQEYEVSLSAEIKTDENSNVLIITLDKSYPRDEISTVTIYYGVSLY